MTTHAPTVPTPSLAALARTEPDAPTLTADEEIALARRIEAGALADGVIAGEVQPSFTIDADELAALSSDGRAAWHELWCANVRLAWWLAARVHRRLGGCYDDLAQEAQLGLADALMRWDHTRGTRFSTVAWTWISHRLDNVCHQQRRQHHELSRLAETPESVDLQAQPAVERWVDGQLPGWLDALPPDDRDLLVRRYGPERATIAQLARDRGVSDTSLRRSVRLALDRAGRAVRGAWGRDGRMAG